MKYFIQILILIVVLILIITPWIIKNPQEDNSIYRLQRLVVAKVDIQPNVLLDTNVVEEKFAFIKCYKPYIKTIESLRGRYASNKICKGIYLDSSKVSEKLIIDPESDNLIVYINSSFNYYSSLTPGMALAFFSGDTTDSATIIPDLNDSTKKFYLRAVEVVEKDDAKSLILVTEIPKDSLNLIGKLANGEWHPIILSRR